MTPISVPQRWLAVLFGAALLLDGLLVVGFGPVSAGLALPGAAAMLACAYLAFKRPAVGALSGVGILLASSVLIRLTDTRPTWLGVENILLSEQLAGVVLVVLVVWRCPPGRATGLTTALVASCLLAMGIRRDVDSSDSDTVMSLLFGFLVLSGAIAAGVYLRRTSRQRVDTEMSELVGKQWPLGAALGVLMFIDIGIAGGGFPLIDFDPGRDPLELFALAGAAATGVCAFFAPRAPLRYALLGSAALAVLPLATGFLTSGTVPVPFTSIAASMALIAYVVRQLDPERAVAGSLAVVVGNGIALWGTSTGYSGLANYAVLLAFLFVVATATGLYFRARDRERNQTMRAAVTTAQQSERMALARELHDVVAHHVTGIVVQAQAAQLVAGKDPQVAVAAMERIEHSGVAALTAMRTLVGSLRDGTMPGDAATEQATTDVAADIRALVDNFPGPRIALKLELPEQLPHEAGRSVLRVVQESLTNVGKHAPDAGLVQVSVTSTDDGVHIRVIDDGAKRPVRPVGGSGGYGLVGMRERVELLGGRFEAGPSGYVGWCVEAWLPLRKESS